ncbi:MAG: DNA polymerase III subunit epsilon [Gammaproteobacteria bacterium]|nr:DNA polymerase III subunit epsilon [Gammaproteobacteria bacterium]
MRQIVLDTETTGLEPAQGHRIIEVGCVEMINRRLTGRHYHQYLQPDREIDAGAAEVHGITGEFLRDKPRFSDVVEEFLDFVRGAELIIHNAPFDLGFLRHEFGLLKRSWDEAACGVVDTLALARGRHPGQKNNLDALCKRYGIDNSERTLHGALLDAEILADVYLAMTGGQSRLLLEAEPEAVTLVSQAPVVRLSADRAPLPVIHASEVERESHARQLEAIDRASGGKCVWLRLDTPA